MNEELVDNLKTRGDRINRRNHTLLARYFYWSEIKRIRFDDVIRILENSEFFVEYQTISRIITSYDGYYAFIKGMSSKDGIKYLKTKYPSWNWD